MRLASSVLASIAIAALVYLAVGDAGESHAETLQGDVTCNESVDTGDLVSILRRAGSIPYDADCLSIAGDLNCDGVIDAKDGLVILIFLAGLTAPPSDCVEPGDALPAPEAGGDIRLRFEAEDDATCGPASAHHIDVVWEVTPEPDAVQVKVTAIFSWGPQQEHNSVEASGGHTFVQPVIAGGHVTIIVEAKTLGSYTSDIQVLQLLPCEGVAPTPEPGLGFTTDPPAPPDPPLAAAPGALKETDVVHLGGSPNGPTSDISVVAVGTGASWRLISFRTDPSTQAPQQLSLTEPFGGYQVKLHVLTPDLSPKLERELLVAAYIEGGNLWLSTWRLDAGGAFTSLDTRGFGANVGVIVGTYAIAHRPIPPGTGGADKFQVVTPLLGEQISPQSGNSTALHTVTWDVNPDTGAINGRQDSGPWGTPDENTEISALHLPGDAAGEQTYVVSYRNSSDLLENAFWTVSNGGAPKLAGSATSGLDLRGSSTVAYDMDEPVLVPVGDGGFVSPFVNGTFLSMPVWEARPDACDPECVYSPYRISDDSFDEQFGPGLDIPDSIDPTLTNGSSSKVANGAIQNVRAILTDALWEESFGVGDGEVFLQIPPGEFTSVGLGSVTKIMTLLLAAEALDAGDVDLDDDVTISEAAATVGGSQVNFVEGDVMQFEDLLYGMMLVSGNDASIAIAEHVGGSVDNFVEKMQERANELGLGDTTYNQPAGGGYSTPQDQVTLWLFAHQDPLFRKYATEKAWDACGEDVGGDPVCYPLVKFGDSNYPGLQGWKGGNVGFSTAENNALGVPLCTSCLTAQATRLGRTFVAALQQSGDRWGDSSDLFDFGYISLFTPDRVASEGPVGSAQDFGLDSIADNLAITSQINSSDELVVCTYATLADQNDIQQLDCVTPRVSIMPGGAGDVEPSRVDAVRISTLMYEGDYLTGHLIAGQLNLGLWRVGPREP